MSYLQVTACRPSLNVSNQYHKVRGSAIQCFAPVNVKSIIGSSKKVNELLKHYIRQRTSVSCYQQFTPVCLFGGKGESKNGNEASPWKSIEKAMSSFKKELSLEDVLKQQMEKQDYYDGGSGGNPPPGGRGGGSGGEFGGVEDEGFAGILDEIVQVTMAILALIALYLYIIASDQVILFITDGLAFLAGKKGPRIRTIMYEFAQFYDKFRTKVPNDPYWLEKAIIATPTYWDSPSKYRRMLKSYIPESSRLGMDTDSDNDGGSDDKAYSDNNNGNDDDDDAYSEDVDED